MNWEQIFSISLYHGYIPQILLAEAIFTFNLQRREKFLGRLAIGLPVCLLLSVILPNIISMYTKGFFSLTIFILSLGLCAFLFKNRISDILFCCVIAQFVQNLSYNLEGVIYLPFVGQIDMVGRFFATVAAMAVTYSAGFFIFSKRLKKIHINRVYVFLLAIATALFVYVMQYLFQAYEIDQIWITRLPLIMCCIFGLGFQYSVLAYTDEQAENEQLELLLKQGSRQYEITKASIDLINMKAHDLKHEIARIQAGGYDKGELDEIVTLVEDYERTVNCGNTTLDVILTEKQLVCKKNHIDFSLIINGAELSFMRSSDLVSLFGNALDNAIECELRVEETDKRCVAVRVFRKDDMISMNFENYCTEILQMENGLPVTSKQDKNYHGFGMKSIRYIVNKYGGSMHMGINGNLFVLNILISCPIS